ncbi:hypothetical protein [Thiohalophilus sp.]|uniref:hypothetical protein n=1 Tax=Thiohalophilus sp. TaxID=3028392 RepID=UPI002ACD2213|nr:hypothetical protein [Thiohalophilus sp.]MDZ7803123.1 hypothetical protein [Thiohalophilus sp.]
MPESTPGPEMWPFGPFVMIIMAVVIILPFWFIFSKAGYSKWLSLLMVVPVVNIILLYFLAFSDWPSLRSANK